LKMAATIIGRICGAGLLKSSNGISLQRVQQFSSTKKLTQGQKQLLTSLGVIAGGAGALIFALDQSVKASGTEVHPAKLPWSHNGLLSSFDHASIRRGYEVYKSVCAACHSLQYVAYRNLVGVSHTEDEAKAEAAEATIRDGPDDTGNYFDRPGKLSDYFPSPYPNEEAARHANNGSYPPDLSNIVLGRHGGEDYIFALLTGYTDQPAGVALREGQYFNPYFPGGAISMAQAIFNETIEYSDGTPASASQIAKDIATFLAWTSQPEHDDRKRYAIKAFTVLGLIFVGVLYLKRHVFSTNKTQKFFAVPRRK